MRIKMGVTYVKEVMSPEELLEAYPLPAEHKKLKEARDAEIKKVFTGESDKFLVIIGPCSADNEDSVCDYINRLAKVQDKVSDKILIIPRIYTNKPRTTGQGYKGIVHQPDPEKEPDLHDGIIAMRKMHLRAIAETHLFAADEMLYPENWPYISDILLCCSRCTFCRGSAASSHCQRFRYPMWYEEPYQRYLKHHA